MAASKTNTLALCIEPEIKPKTVKRARRCTVARDSDMARERSTLDPFRDRAS